MTRSAYEAGRLVRIVRVVAVAAVLLSLVAATGYYLMMGGIGYKVVLALVLTDLLAFVALKTARGSQRRARARAASVTRSAPAAAVLPVQGAWFVHKGERVPLGEAFDRLLG